MPDKISEFWGKTSGWRLPLIGFICFIFALATVLFRSPPPENHAINNPPESPFYKTIGGIGVIEPKSENISIGTEIPGIVRNINVIQNEDVKKDHLLFSLDQRDIDRQIAELEASLVSAKVQYEDAQKYFELVQDIKDYRAISKEDFDRRKYAAQLNYARVLEIQTQIERAYTTKDRMHIRAPIDGRVLNINVRPGEFAPAGALDEPLMIFGDMSTINLRVEFDEENIANLSSKSNARAYKRSDTSKVYHLTFVRFEPYVRAKQNLAVSGQRVDTRVLQVIYAIESKDRDLFSGEEMDVFVEDVKTQ